MRESWTDKRLDERFDGVDRRFDQVDRRLDGIEGRLRGVENRLSGVEGRLELLTSIDNHLQSFEQRFAAYQRATLQMSGLIIAALIGLIATQL